MSNHHLRNKDLTLKAKGLLSQMLSLPEDWDYTLVGLSRINREKIDAMIRAPTGKPMFPTLTTEYRCAAEFQAARGLMTAAVTKTDRRFLCPFSGSRKTRQERRISWNFSTAQ